MQQAVGRGDCSIGSTVRVSKTQRIMILQDDDRSYEGGHSKLFKEEHKKCQTAKYIANSQTGWKLRQQVLIGASALPQGN